MIAFFVGPGENAGVVDFKMGYNWYLRLNHNHPSAVEPFLKELQQELEVFTRHSLRCGARPIVLLNSPASF